DNQALLETLGVSSHEIAVLVAAARRAGALGAKLTGGGAGGAVIALAPDPEALARRIEDGGGTAPVTRVGEAPALPTGQPPARFFKAVDRSPAHSRPSLRRAAGCLASRAARRQARSTFFWLTFALASSWQQRSTTAVSARGAGAPAAHVEVARRGQLQLAPTVGDAIAGAGAVRPAPQRSTKAAAAVAALSAAIL